MNTFKTAVVVVVLLGILYLANSWLNQGDPPPPPPGVTWEDSTPEIDVGEETDNVVLGRDDSNINQLANAQVLQTDGSQGQSGGISTANQLGSPTLNNSTATDTNHVPPPATRNVVVPSPKQPAPGENTQGEVVTPLVKQQGNGSLANSGGSTDRREDVSAAKSNWPKGIRRARPYDAAMKNAKRHLAKKDYRAALYGLSLFHNSPDLSTAERKQLLNLLDPLAGKVIYSREHFWKAYKVGRRESLKKIAEQYQVPWQLLAKINGIRDPDVLVPGIELKVVPGPFSAEVDLDRKEITVFANVNLYAGRFSFELGQDPKPQAGLYTVVEKRPGKHYFREDGTKVPRGFPENPYGEHWIGLGGRVGFHGSPKYPVRGSQTGYCMRLSARDAEDLYAILSKDSSVKIRPPAVLENAKTQSFNRTR